jgi:uncharacterized membrane protein
VVDATWDLRDAHPDAGARGIAVAGIRRGRQRLADVAATVSLAYAGVALPLLVLLSAGDQRVVDALGGDALGAEMTRALGGLVALTATLPLTAAIAAVVVVRERDGAAPVGDPRQFRSRRERRLFQDEG